MLYEGECLCLILTIKPDFVVLTMFLKFRDPHSFEMIKFVVTSFAFRIIGKGGDLKGFGGQGPHSGLEFASYQSNDISGTNSKLEREAEHHKCPL